MTATDHRQAARASHHSRILEHAEQRLPTDRHEEMARYLTAYYRRMDPEDMAERRSDDLYGAALAHWNLARRRPPGLAVVRVVNPTVEEHGWQSTHTIIEVINDDMPFLVDSVTMEANRQGLTLHLIVHPIITVTRDAAGVLTGLAPDDANVGTGNPLGKPTETITESFLHLEVDRITDAQSLEDLQSGITRVLADVRRAVTDWPQMQAGMTEVIAKATAAMLPIAEDELTESLAFLDWLTRNNFIFLGYRRHELVEESGEDVLRIVPGSALGILRDASGQPAQQAVAASFAALPPELRARARRPEMLVVTKSTSRSTVHRPGYLDHIAVKRFDKQGHVCGEHRFLGLFTSSAYSTGPDRIPLLRRKIARVLEASGLGRAGHAGKAFINILQTYPRDELFQIDEEELLRTATGILHLGDRQRLRLFVRRDPFERFLSCLIYAPRENYHTGLRQRWQQILIEALNGSNAEFNVYLSESVIARVHITVRTSPGNIPVFDVAALERQLVLAARRWEDDLRDSLIAAAGEGTGNALFRRFELAFPASYIEDNPPRLAVSDINQIMSLTDEQPVAVRLYRAPEAAPGTLRFKLFHRGSGVMLSNSMPMLEHTGLLIIDERPHEITPVGMPSVWVHDFGLCTSETGGELPLDSLAPAFEAAFLQVFTGAADSDAFNRLVVTARMPIEEVTVLRAYARYMHQTGFALSQTFIANTLDNHPDMARQLIDLFKTRFDPACHDEDSTQAQDICAAIESRLDAVENLSEDRVLRQLLALMLATVRTSYWRRDEAGEPRPYLALKFNPTRIPNLPAPVPAWEIFVHSPRFEGVHLRGSTVARGGLRWSDRPEDFRTEVLGLMKAQMVKNTVIVPGGSKGGFVLRRPPSPTDRDAWIAEGVACYKNYLRGLLDVTDNRVGNQIVPPPDTRGPVLDDPYLVVAADKGTATFSDHANAVSREYGFWLDDAFASGGSAGYDHKAMGITARGAWESVRRHFRALGVNVQTTDFTVAGVGDMSGDVFGNGMLLSEHIRLVAAFDHRHIFLDPDPDSATSFAERKRLFALPRSSWADYDTRLLSEGGGVFSRSAKSIRLNDAVRKRLGITAPTLTPTELISEILKAPVDLLFNGGIGTYIKATSEDHADAGDRANDALRVNGAQLRCRVVVEGGNLGLTQLGRIEFALNGGHIFTDAIDNSAGVSTSDHEVNIKILLGLAVADGELTTRQRDKQLAAMTDTVAQHVLRDNTLQTRIISLACRQSAENLDADQRFMRALEKSGQLSRTLEYLPDDEMLAIRRAAGQGLVAPEHAVLLAYCKNLVYDQLLASDLPDDNWVTDTLRQYFPAQLHKPFGDCMTRHPLRREIITMAVMNGMINRVGYTFIHRQSEATGATTADVARAWLIVRESFQLEELWALTEANDDLVDDGVQASLLMRIGKLVERTVGWTLRSHRLTDPLGPTITTLRSGIQTLMSQLDQLLDAQAASLLREQIEHIASQGVPVDLAQRICALGPLEAAPDIIGIASDARADLPAAARIHFAVARRLDLPWLRERIAALPGNQHWRMLARAALFDDLAAIQRRVAGEVLTSDNALTAGDDAVAVWFAHHAASLARAEQLLAELRQSAEINESMLTVAIRELRQVG